jgi:hypothetical protein
MLGEQRRLRLLRLAMPLDPPLELERGE